MLANFAIGLREGLEAALVVGILVAYLKKQNRQDDVRRVAIGVFAAIFVSLVVGLSLTFLTADAEDGASKFIAGIASLVAVVFVTWMIFWMSAQSRALAGELHKKIDLASTSVFTLVGVAFFAVIREGVETSVFLWSSSRAAGDDTNPVLGATLGLLVAAALGYLIYRGALKLNISKFFKYTGAFLILVAAGILAYGIHELQEIGWFPFLTEKAYDLTGIIPKDSVVDVLLRGTISFRSAPAILESIVWFAYLIPVTYIYLRPTKKN